MNPLVPLVTASVWVGLAVLAVLVVLVLAGRAFGDRGDDWSTAGRGSTAGGDVVCPRCHHKTPPDATDCPECGKEL